MVEMGRGRKGSMQSTGVCAEVGRAGDAQDRGGEGEGSESSTTARESGRRRGGWKTIYLVYSRSGCVEDSPISQLSPRAHARLERSPNAGQAPSPIGHPVAWRVGCSQPTEITCPIRLGPRTSPRSLARPHRLSARPAGRTRPRRASHGLRPLSASATLRSRMLSRPRRAST